jgi:hypothetical protein
VPVDRYDHRTRRSGQVDDALGEVSQIDDQPIVDYQILTR